MNKKFDILQKTKNIWAWSLVIVCLITQNSCTEKIQPEPELGAGYFPTALGSWIEYAVDSIYIDGPVEKFDTLNFYRRDIIESNITDAQNRPSQRIERYIKTQLTDAWAIRDVWFQTLTENTAERVEENVRYVKLQIPLDNNKTWDGNQFNGLDAWNYKVTKLHEPFSINGLNFDSTVTIEQIDSVNLVQRLYGKEVWARGVGLIYKKYTNYSFQPGISSSKKGVEYEYTVRSYGKE